MEGQPHKQKVHRAMKDLQKAKLVEQRRDDRQGCEETLHRTVSDPGAAQRLNMATIAAGNQTKRQAALIPSSAIPHYCGTAICRL